MGEELVYDGYGLVFEDRFEGNALNREHWNVELHEPGWVNEEWQRYVDSEDNIRVRDGRLVIRPVRTRRPDGTFDYTSGRISTQHRHDFTYGIFEVSLHVPAGKGYLPAFWLMTTDEARHGQWPVCGEIDIMEILGQHTETNYGTIHYGLPHKQDQGSVTLAQGDFSSGFHTFSLLWEPGRLRWYVDGRCFHTVSDWYSVSEEGKQSPFPAPFDHDMYIILNLAVGGTWVGYPDETTDFKSAALEVDYVRVYQKKQ